MAQAIITEHHNPSTDPSTAIPPQHQQDLLGIVKKYKSHNTLEAKQDFLSFESRSTALANQVYKNLWQLKGSPTHLHPDYGRQAFHHLNGFYSQDNEKAEAILLAYSSVEKRLDEMSALFTDTNEEEALKQFKEFQRVYPKVADFIFGKLWEIYGKPTHESRPDIAHDQFGSLVFFNKHSKLLSSEPLKKMQAIEFALPGLKQVLADPKFCSEQNRSRRDVRCVEVIQEQLDILKQGYYIAPSGEKRDIQAKILDSIEKTKICENGGTAEPKQPRFKHTVFEVRPQNCVTVAYDLAVDKENKVNLMNFANSHVPGGAYLHHAGTQEEEIFRCTGLPVALDQTHGAQQRAFYPIHHKAGKAGGIFTPNVLLIRSGLDHDYQLLEIPLTISVGTFAAFDCPELNYTDPAHPRLQGDALYWTREKLRTYFYAAYIHGDDTLILGAFGGGAFRNPPDHILELILDINDKEYPGCFKKIVFAVLKDGNEGLKHNPEGNFQPFARAIKQRGGKVYGTNGELV